MLSKNIQVGDDLCLKPDNPYGISSTVEVVEIKPNPGYVVPWIVGVYLEDDPFGVGISRVGHFKPSDFAGRAES